jgi:hypothetical protein
MASPLDIMYNNMKIEGSKNVGFGKYYMRTYEEVYTQDYGYCRWAMSVNPESFLMYDFQRYIHKMNKICWSCGEFFLKHILPKKVSHFNLNQPSP